MVIVVLLLMDVQECEQTFRQILLSTNETQSPFHQFYNFPRTKSNNKMSQRKERNGSFFESVFTLLANKRSTIGMDFGTTTASRRTIIIQDTRTVRMSPIDYTQTLHIYTGFCMLKSICNIPNIMIN